MGELVTAGLLKLLLFISSWAIALGITDWASHGGDILNHRSASSRISVHNVKRLHLQWKVDVGADVTATPAIAAKEGIIYFPTWGGVLYAMEADSGRVVWQRNLSRLLPGAVARATPALAGPRLLLSLLFPPRVVAFNRSSGALLWSSALIDPHPAAILTMSGTVHNRFYYAGASSTEEMLTTNCCYFQGSVSKIRVANGEIVWQTSMLPDNGGRVGGYAGAGVWGSSPSIDKSRGLLFVATGNNYQVPSSVVQCKEQSEQGGGVETGGFTPDNCLDPNNHAESIVAIELDTGKIAWSKHLGGYDVFSSICFNTSTKPAQCASTLGPDYDFGQAPMVLYLPCSSKSHLNTSCIVVAAQKSGIVWALDCANGDIVWYKRAGPGSALGGSMWGSSTDRKHVFTGISNFYHLDFELKSLHGNDSGTTNGGGWVALDATTGNVKWAIANPSPNIDLNVTGGASTFGPVSTSHGIVWATSFDAHGHVYAIDSRNGAILWEYQTSATVYGGFSIGDSCVFVGNGYNASAAIGGTLGKFMHAFCLPL